MYNQLAYNEGAYGASPAAATDPQPTTLIQFDGYDLNTAASASSGDRILIQTLDENGPIIELDKFDVPLGNGVRVNGLFRRGKIIPAEGVVFADTGAELEELLDDIKKNLRKMNRPLDITRYGVTRRYPYATMIGMDKIFKGRKGSDITRCPLSLSFLVTDVATGWEYEETTQQITAAEDTVAVESGGTTESKPIIVVVFSAATGITSLNVSIDENDSEIEIPHAFAAGEALVIDCEEETLTINGVEVEFDGQFPEMELGANTFRFADDGSARTYRVTILAKDHYL